MPQPQRYLGFSESASVDLHIADLFQSSGIANKELPTDFRFPMHRFCFVRSGWTHDPSSAHYPDSGRRRVCHSIRFWTLGTGHMYKKQIGTHREKKHVLTLTLMLVRRKSACKCQQTCFIMAPKTGPKKVFKTWLR